MKQPQNVPIFTDAENMAEGPAIVLGATGLEPPRVQENSSGGAGALAEPPVLDHQGETPPAAPDRANFHHFRKERQRRIIWSLGTAIVTRPLALLVPLVTVPMFLHYLGKEGYGLYESIVALAAYLAFSNVGMWLALVNKLTDCHVSGDRNAAQRYVASLWYPMLATSVIGVAILSFVVPHVEWSAIFKTSDPARFQHDIVWTVWIAACSTLLGVVVGIPMAIYSGYQELHRNNMWDAFSKLAMLGACFGVCQTHWGLPGVTFAMTSVPVLVRLANTLFIFCFEKPWLLPRLGLFDYRLLRMVFVEGMLLCSLQLATMFMYSSDKIIISATIDAEAVAPFAVVGRLFVAVYAIYMLLLAPMWPAYGEAIRRGDIVWVKRGVKVCIAVAMVTLGSFGLIMLICGNSILHLWTHGSSVDVPRMLVLGLAVSFLMRSWIDSRSIALNSAGVLVPQALLLGANGILNIIFGILLAWRFGPVGVAWSIPISTALTGAWGYPWLMHRYIKELPQNEKPAPSPAPAIA